jgi:hypothetical protein
MLQGPFSGGEESRAGLMELISLIECGALNPSMAIIHTLEGYSL